MTATATTTRVRAMDLQAGDVFAYSHTTVTVTLVTRLLDRLVEVEGIDGHGDTRYIDYSTAETVEVSAGPSLAQRVAVAQSTPSYALLAAVTAVKAGRTRSLPASATLVLYAVAAAQESAPAPSLAQVAAAAGLAQSTTSGHLRSLAIRGLVGGTNDGGWMVAR